MTTRRSLAAAAALAAATTSSAGDLPVARCSGDGLPLTRCWGEMRLDSCSNACAIIMRDRECAGCLRVVRGVQEG